MDVGLFAYTVEGESSALSGVQPTLTLWYETAETRGLVVQQDGLWGVVDLEGQTVVEIAYEAVFAAPFGDAPGWYGLRDGAYELLDDLDAGSARCLTRRRRRRCRARGLCCWSARSAACWWQTPPRHRLSSAAGHGGAPV